MLDIILIVFSVLIVSIILIEIFKKDCRDKTLKPGQKWKIVYRKENPWKKDNVFIITILDIKNNWVKYKYSDESTCEEPINLFFEQPVYKIKEEK